MPKTKQQKQEVAQQLIDKFKESKSAIFVDYKGITASDVSELRSECRKENSEYLVAKKTLIKIATDENKVEGVNPKEIEGNLAVVFGYEDEVAPARMIKNFIKKHKILKMMGGVVGGQFLDDKMVKALADVPSKPELYARLVGSINAPVSGFVNVLHANLRGLVYVLNAVKESKS